jgi:hypothetical protein
VGNNDAVIYTDASTDPYDNTTADLDSNEAVMNDNIGSDNYDIGHVVNTQGGGVAYLGVVCDNSSKWGGMTGAQTPTADPFIIDYVAHEIGHQFGGEHTFNGTAGSCATRAENDAYEPGSGSTIMAYAGICDEQNLQVNSDAYFHSHSIEQIGNFVNATATCAITTAINNEQPVVSAGNDYTVPASTPLKLQGTATDSDDDILSYSWEQFDLGSVSTDATSMVDDGSRPLFRTYLPTSESSRYLPKLTDLIAGTNTIGETFATTSRDMTFKLIVRDGKGNTANDDMKVAVDSASGPFTITAPIAGDSWTNNLNPTITWNIANTNQPPVDCANVDMLFSTDNGITFDTVLLQSTANDGTEQISMPAVKTTTARLLIKCSDNIFFAINSGRFSVDGTTGVAPQITGQSVLTLDEDTSLTLTFESLVVVDNDSAYPTGFNMTLSAGDNYTVNGNQITPTANFNGSLTIPVILNDGTLDSNLFNLDVTVNPVNDAPSIINQNTIEINEDNTIAINTAQLTIEDVDNTVDDMTIVVKAGSNYTLNDNVLSPTANFSGILAIPVAVTDGEITTPEFTLIITVNAVNDNPIATDDNLTVEENSVNNNLSILSNDSDVDQDALTISAINYTGSGILVNASSALTYTPGHNFDGNETVTYTVSDGNGGTATATLTIKVNTKPSASGSFSLILIILMLPLAIVRRRGL